MDKNKIIEQIKKFGYEAELVKVKKNGGEKEGIVFYFADSNINPTLYFDNKYFKGMDEYEIASEMINIAIENKKSNVNIDFIYNWNTVKDHIIPCVACIDTMNTDFVRRNIIGDIAQYLRVKVDINSEENATIPVTASLFEKWGISIDEALDVAYSNIENDFLIYDFMLFNVLSNKDKLYGAAHMFNKKAYKYIAEKLNCDVYYILPSSVHEVIIIKYDNKFSTEDLIDMVHTVNDTEVSPQETLSYGVYKYDAIKDTLTEV